MTTNSDVMRTAMDSPGQSGADGGSDEASLSKYLKKLCSDVTLVSRKDGFFNKWLQEVQTHLMEEDVLAFGKLTKDSERVKFLWRYKPVHMISLQSFRREKNLSYAEQKRAEGNAAFQKKEEARALMLYSQAVMRAPAEGDCLSVCLANRSAALFHCGKTTLCLQDITAALDAGYPKNLRFKIYDRKGQCLERLEKWDEARDAFRICLDFLKSAGLEPKKFRLWAADLEAKIGRCEGRSSHSATDKKDSPLQKGALYRGASSVFPRASSCLSLESSEEGGRFFVASEDIPAGKVLITEAPFSSVLMTEKAGSHCGHCTGRLEAPLPCPHCSGIAFCSPGCRDAALSTYHKWECPYLELLRAAGISLNCYLALRIITERNTEIFRQIWLSMESSSRPQYSQSHVQDPEDFRSFYHLAALEDRRDVFDFLGRTLMAIFLLKVLQEAGYFGKKQDAADEGRSPLTEDEVTVGSLLLRSLQVIQFNAHEVSGIMFSGEPAFKRAKSVFLGLAIYPTVAYCNHSCYPSLARYFDGKKMSVLNLRPLAKGMPVYENYGPIFTHHPRQERQRKLLSRYWFRCQCEACAHNWPTYPGMPTSLALRCPVCEQKLQVQSIAGILEASKEDKARLKVNEYVTCICCGKSSHAAKMVAKVVEAHQAYDFGIRAMDEFRREEAIHGLTKWVDVAANYVLLPFKDLHLALEALRLLIAARGTAFVVAAQKSDRD